MINQNEYLKKFRQHFNKEFISINHITGSGSDRNYFRLSDGKKSFIGVEGPSPDENRTFVSLAGHFRAKGLPVPEVYAVSDDYQYYLQEDLGDQSLFDWIVKGRETGIFSDEEKKLLKRTIQELPAFQLKGAAGLDFSVCFPQPEFDKRTIFWDLNYFKYCFLKNAGIQFKEDLLEDDFEKLAGILLRDLTSTFMYRDFQSRNVMLRSDNPFFIDFQGGRKGPVYYDVASFIWQAKANFPDQLKEELLTAYLDSLEHYFPGLDRTHFRLRLRYFVLFRILQVLGAYGFRGYMEKKAHFIESIPYAIANLRSLLQEDFRELPYLISILNKLLSPERFQIPEKRQVLEIRILSFSYKKGIPDDFSGNGGGYVFDCRAIHNPGKYKEYQSLTGLDKPVINFLEGEGQIVRFMEHVYALADSHVTRYLERGFTHLMFSFGCTGGQHRSVYAAQHLADCLAKKYPVDILLEHREQGIKTEIYKL